MASSESPELPPPKRILIINADDLGYSQARDDGILKAFTSGSVTSASLLVNAFTSQSAAQRAIQAGLPLGLHLNLTEGMPVSKHNTASLVDEKSGLFLGKMGFREACEQGRINPGELRIEILAQIEEFRRLTFGRVPTHVDGHQHCHILRATRTIFAQVLKEANISLRTRLPLEAPLFLSQAGNAAFLRSVISDATDAMNTFKENEISFPDYFVGLTLSGKSSFGRVWSSFMTVPMSQNESICEWMVHPGSEEENLGGGFPPGYEPDGFAYALDRRNELDILCDANLQSVLVETEGFTLKSFEVLPATNALKRHHGIKLRGKRTCCILTSATPMTGNQSTAMRLRAFLVKSGWTCLIADANELGSAPELDLIIKRYQVDVVLGIHAYRAGRLLVGSTAPYAIVLGGTDMNERVYMEDEGKRKIMIAALERSKAVVAFCESLADKARSLLAEGNEGVITIIPQSVAMPSCNPRLMHSLQNEDKIEFFTQLLRRCSPRSTPSIKNGPILLLPLGIRAVKDPLFLLGATISDLPDCTLILAGPELDPELTAKVRAACRANVWYVGPLMREELLEAMSRSDVVVNCSITEGMSNTILEAMALKHPLLIVRDIEGNRALVTHGKTGLLFKTPEEFVSMVRNGLSDASLKDRLVNAAYDKLLAMARESKEEETYNALLSKIADSASNAYPTSTIVMDKVSSPLLITSTGHL